MSAYQSILRKRIRNVTLRDFRECSGIALEGKDHFVINGREAETWNRHFPYTPGQLKSLLADGYASPVSLKFVLSEPPYSQALIKMRFGRQTGAFGEIDYRTTDDPYIFFSRIRLPEEKRGLGTGKIFMRSMIEFDIAMGGTSNRFNAGYDNGGYTWARMGARINTDPYYQPQRTKASLQIEGRLMALRPHIPENIFQGALALSGLSGEDDLINLANRYRNVMIGTILSPCYDTAINRAFSSRLKDYHYVQADGAGDVEETLFAETTALNCAFRWSAMQGYEGVSLPRFLLTGVVWPALIDYSDREQMEKVGKYLGGWKTIRPVENRPVMQVQSIPALVSG